MSEKDTSIRVRCSERTKRDWEWFSTIYDTNEEALKALMEKKGVYDEMSHKPNF